MVNVADKGAFVPAPSEEPASPIEVRRRAAREVVLNIVEQSLQDLRDKDFEEDDGTQRAVYLVRLGLDRLMNGRVGLPGRSPNRATLAKMVGLADVVNPSTSNTEAPLRGRVEPLRRRDAPMRPTPSNVTPQLKGQPHPSPSSVVKKAQAEIHAQEMLDLVEVAAILFAARTPAATERVRKQFVELTRSGALIALRRGKRVVYPAFQIDRQKRNIYPEVKQVNELLGAADDPWGVASWWMSPHAGLGAPPMTLVGTSEAAQLVALVEAIHDDGY